MEVALARVNGGERGQEDRSVRKGPWTVEEDIVLMSYVALNGDGGWNSLARAAGLNRTGKSCRLRWLHYLRPGLRRGSFTPEEHEHEHALVVELQSRWGNRWAKIARHLPGRTDNDVKNFWRTKILKKRKPCGDSGASAQLVTTGSQASTGTSPRSSSTMVDGVLIRSSVHAAAEQSLSAVHGGCDGADGGAMTALPELVATESRDNFSWAFEDIWPAPLRSFNFSL